MMLDDYCGSARSAARTVDHNRMTSDTRFTCSTRPARDRLAACVAWHPPPASQERPPATPHCCRLRASDRSPSPRLLLVRCSSACAARAELNEPGAIDVPHEQLGDAERVAALWGAPAHQSQVLAAAQPAFEIAERLVESGLRARLAEARVDAQPEAVGDLPNVGTERVGDELLARVAHRVSVALVVPILAHGERVAER
eukprot:5033556-Prymnesium_polylepis.1